MQVMATVFIKPDDNMRASTDQPGLVSLHVEDANLSVIFGTATEDECTEAVGTIDRLVAALQDMRTELLVRAVTFGPTFTHGELVPATDDGETIGETFERESAGVWS